MRRLCVGVVGFVILALLAPLSATSASTRWAVVPSPNIVVRHGSLNAVSCVTVIACEAVGIATDPNGAQVYPAESWNGTSWSIQSTPKPPGATLSQLSGISCVALPACIAVGSYYDGSGNGLTLAETWNGTSWSIQPTPNPSGSLNSNLTAISCTAATSCSAVGSYDSGPLAEAWNGTSWSIQPTPNPSGSAATLSAVSCAGSTACMAVGSYYDSSGVGLTLAEAWDGTNWSILPAANPSGSTFSYLAAISCTGTTACMAVGSYSDSSGNGLTLAEAWNGTSWSIQPTPNPLGSTNSYLVSIACIAPTACMAVGSSNDSSGSLAIAITEGWNGTAWVILPAVNPPGSVVVRPSGVSCPAANLCMAVGSYSYGFVLMNLAEIWNGARWSIQAPFGPFGEVDSGLVGVSCSAASACAAVGGTNLRRGSFGTEGAMVTEVWNGTKWSLEAAPNPTTARSSVLSGVYCSTASACMAVGNYRNKSGLTSTLAEFWNGSGWSIRPTPNPSGASSSRLAGISCIASMGCIAVGSYYDNSGSGLTLAEAGTGTGWSIQPTPNPSGSTASSLAAVSCSAATACIAVGSYYDSSGVGLTLAEAWSGNSWSIQPTPNPSGSAGSALSSISCSGATACVAVGSYYDSSGVGLTLAEAWDGTSWSIQPSPNPSGALFGNLSGVSCIASRGCIAVGNYSDTSGRDLSLAEAWNGTTWSIQPTPSPSGPTSINLSSVSCISSPTCMAVGDYFSVSEKTLAEAWP